MSWFDVKLHTPLGVHSWTGEYASVWDAVQVAHERAENDRMEDQVFAVVATRSLDFPHGTWTCAACGRPGLPNHLRLCDNCGVERGKDSAGPSPWG